MQGSLVRDPALALAVTLSTLLAAVAQANDVIISEILAINRTSLTGEDSEPLVDEDGEPSDWIELFNTSAATIDLEGWHLTDSDRAVDKWTFPSVALGPGEMLVVFASGKDRRDPASELHLNFRLLHLEGDSQIVQQKYCTHPEEVHQKHRHHPNHLQLSIALKKLPVLSGHHCY